MTSGQGAAFVPFPRSGEPYKGLRTLRLERGWSQADAVRAMMAAATDKEKKGLPGSDSLLQNWKRWEAGKVVPDGMPGARPFYRPIIARIFGVSPEQVFPSIRDSSARRVTDVGDLRDELESRRAQVRQDISKLEQELAYLTTLLTAIDAVPVPAASR